MRRLGGWWGGIFFPPIQDERVMGNDSAEMEVEVLNGGGSLGRARGMERGGEDANEWLVAIRARTYTPVAWSTRWFMLAMQEASTLSYTCLDHEWLEAR